MAQEKSVTKKDIRQLLDSQTQTILAAVDKKIDDKIDGLAVMMRNGLQETQDLIIKRVDEKADALAEDVRHVNFKLDKIDKKLDSQEKILLNHDQRIDKLEIDGKKMKKILAI